MDEWAVETRNLSKIYGDKIALDKLNLNVKGGEILVILGPNGSGKTTFLHLVTTVLRPSSGTALVMGYDIVGAPLKVRQVTSISFQDPRGFWRHKPAHILSFHASMYGVSAQERKRVVEKTMKEFELWDSKDTRFMHLSGGQAKRLEVAKLFVYSPKLAIFDEPTTMVDLDGKRMIWDKILELKERGSTVIVATNEVREAEYLADKITIFASGRDLVTDSISNLKDTVRGGDIVDLEFVMRANFSTKVAKDLVDWKAYYLIETGGVSKLLNDRMSLRFYGKKQLENLLEETGFSVLEVLSGPSKQYEESSPSLYFVAEKE